MGHLKKRWCSLVISLINAKKALRFTNLNTGPEGDYNKPAKTTSGVCPGKQHDTDMSQSQRSVFCFPPSLPVRELLPHVVSTWFAYKQMLQA